MHLLERLRARCAPVSARRLSRALGDTWPARRCPTNDMVTYQLTFDEYRRYRSGELPAKARSSLWRVSLPLALLAVLPAAAALWYGQWLFSVGWLVAWGCGLALHVASARQERTQFSGNAFASGSITLLFDSAFLRAESGNNLLQFEYSQLRLLFEYAESLLI